MTTGNVVIGPLGAVQPGLGGSKHPYAVGQVRVIDDGPGGRIQLPGAEVTLTFGGYSVDASVFRVWLQEQPHPRPSMASSGAKYAPCLIRPADPTSKEVRVQVPGSEYNRPYGACFTIGSAPLFQAATKILAGFLPMKPAAPDCVDAIPGFGPLSLCPGCGEPLGWWGPHTTEPCKWTYQDCVDDPSITIPKFGTPFVSGYVSGKLCKVCNLAWGAHDGTKCHVEPSAIYVKFGQHETPAHSTPCRVCGHAYAGHPGPDLDVSVCPSSADTCNTTQPCPHPDCAE